MRSLDLFSFIYVCAYVYVFDCVLRANIEGATRKKKQQMN